MMPNMASARGIPTAQPMMTPRCEFDPPELVLAPAAVLAGDAVGVT